MRFAALVVVLVVAAFGGAPLAESQPIGKTARVGILDVGSSYPEREALWGAFKQAPMLTKLGVVWDNNPAMTLAVQDTEVAARTMSVSVHAMVARSQDELDKAFADRTGVPVHALEVMPTPVALRERHLAELALKYRLPTAFAQREYVEDGTARALGLAVPPSLQVRADHLVE